MESKLPETVMIVPRERESPWALQATFPNLFPTLKAISQQAQDLFVYRVYLIWKLAAKLPWILFFAKCNYCLKCSGAFRMLAILSPLIWRSILMITLELSVYSSYAITFV